jgi:hypothetical protein
LYDFCSGGQVEFSARERERERGRRQSSRGPKERERPIFFLCGPHDGKNTSPRLFVSPLFLFATRDAYIKNKEGLLYAFKGALYYVS